MLSTKAIGFSLFVATYSIADMVKMGMAAEKWGFDSFLIGDHILDFPPGLVRVEPWTILTAVGVQTRRLRLCTDVTDVKRSHPARLAHQTATLDELTGGRVSLGLGAGERMNLDPFGIPLESVDQRLERLKEGIEVIKLLWQSSFSNRVTYDGHFYRMRDAWVEQKPVQRPSPPIYIGALGSTRALTLVGEIADGWLPAHNTLELFRERVAVIREGARRVGRDPEAIDTGAAVIGVPTRDPEVRKKALEAYKATVLVLTPRRVLKAMGFDPQAPAGVRYFYQRALAHEDGARLAGEIAKAMPDELVEKFVVTGGPDQFIEAIDRYREAGARHIIFWDMVAESLQNSTERGIANLRVFHDKVMPYFGRSA